MVLHRHVRKREQSSFSLQAQHCSFCHHAIVSVIYEPTIGMPGWQANLSPASRLPRADTHAVGHITSYLPPIYPPPSKSGTLSLSSLSSPYSPRPMPALLGSQV